MGPDSMENRIGLNVDIWAHCILLTLTLQGDPSASRLGYVDSVPTQDDLRIRQN